MCKAVIMAGGEGKRLRPITCTLPKPMVPLLNKPVIDYCIELLKKHSVGHNGHAALPAKRHNAALRRRR